MLSDEDIFYFGNGMDIVAYVNDRWAGFDIISDNNIIVKYTFTVGKVKVDHFDLTITEPIAGVKPSYDATYPAHKGYEVPEEYDNGPWLNGVMWERTENIQDFFIPLPGNTRVFIKDELYTVRIFIRSAYPEYISLADGGELTATVNGHEATVVTYTDDGSIKDGYVIIEYAFPPTQGTVISEIAVTIPPTSAGEQMKWTASAPDSADYAIDSSSSGFKANGVMWYIDNAAVTPGKVRYFEEGVAYKVSVSVKTKADYSFAAAENLTATVNGKSAAVSRTSDSKIWVSYTFTAAAPPELSTISSVAVTLPEPEAYAHRSYQATLPLGAEYQLGSENDDLWKNGVSWAINGTAVDVSSDELLHPGDAYYISVILDISDAQTYAFADDAHLTATVNGKAATVSVFGDRQRCVVYYIGSVPGGGYVLGDADDDGEVTILDATCIQRKLAGLKTTSYNEKAADADEDGDVTILDATAIQRKLAGLKTNKRIGTVI